MTRIAAILLIFCCAVAQAAPPVAVAPARASAPVRYVSQRTDKAYLREGPTYAHKVLWQYRHRGYPFAVIAQFDTWRRVRAADGTVGWMAASMLSEQRTVLVTGKGRAKIYKDAEGGKLVALAEPGAVASLKACTPSACRIKGDKTDGWIARDRIWGVEPNEVFDKISSR